MEALGSFLFQKQTRYRTSLRVCSFSNYNLTALIQYSMHFLVQSNIYSDPDHARIFDILEDLQFSYEKIHLPPGANSLDLAADRRDIFVYGSVRLARLAKQYEHWSPGSFYGGNHLFKHFAPHYQANLLNYQVEVFPFGKAIQWEAGEQKFIKPYKEAKIFTGNIFTQIKWEDFVAQSLAQPATPLLHQGALVQASIPQKIYKEARLWVVGDQVVDAVYYKFHGDVTYERQVAPEGIEFAKAMIKTFSVAPAFVMDICLTTEGWKIVEINCINSAGFYPTSDVRTVVKALELCLG
ncbi:MAG: ATP-grasp domain-containing protein [Aureispira sp.]